MKTRRKIIIKNNPDIAILVTEIPDTTTLKEAGNP